MFKWLLLLLFLFGCKSLQQDKRCHLKPDPGPCKAAITKYYYNQKEGKCQQFTWGGCHGQVPFDFLEECESCIESGS